MGIEDDKTETDQNSTSTAETSSMKTKIVDEMLTRQMSFDISEEILDFGKTEDEVDVAGGVRRRSLRSVSPPTVVPKKSKKTTLKEKESKSKDPEIKPDKKQTESRLTSVKEIVTVTADNTFQESTVKKSNQDGCISLPTDDEQPMSEIQDSENDDLSHSTET